MGLLGNKKEDDNIQQASGAEAIKFLPANPRWLKVSSFNISFLMILLTLELCYIFRSFLFKNFRNLFIIFNNFSHKRILGLKIYLFIAALFILISFIEILLFLTKLKKPRFDKWMVDLAYKHLSTQFVWYKGKKLLIDFDRNLNKKDVMEFVTELSNKSTEYTYYYNNIDFKQGIASVTVSKRQEIPNIAELDIEKDDTAWNVIPLGLSVNHKLKKVTPVCWWLNDNIKRKDVMITNPSTSILISGGTGSGKSVLQQCIVGHISRNPDHFMMVGCDVKMVEFNDFVGVSSVKRVALTLEEVGDAVEQAKDLMYERFNFMKENHKNNIYKVEANVDCYIIKSKNGSTKQYQFDEIFSCFINEESKLLKIESIYREVMNGSEVKIDSNYEDVGCSLLTKDNIEKSTCKYTPKAMVIMIDEMTEVMSGSNYKIVSKTQENIGSIARLGRAAGCHLVLATQRPSSNVINADLKNNIQQSVLLGDFDSGISSLVFDNDISHMSKPEIKGRGFIKAGKEIIEFQSYWTEPKRDFHFNETKDYSKENDLEEIKEDNNNENDNGYSDTINENIQEQELSNEYINMFLEDSNDQTSKSTENVTINWDDDDDIGMIETKNEKLPKEAKTINLNLNNSSGKNLKLNLNKNTSNNTKKVLKFNKMS